MKKEINPAKLADSAVRASIWRPSSVQVEPQTTLTGWRVYEVDGGNDYPITIHFVGWAGYEGRVCSPIQEYDPTTKRGITRSGRVYELKGSSGHNRDAAYVWGVWCDRNNIVDVKDITHEYDTDS